MKVLFICRGNVGRSQMAAAFYNQLTKSDNAYSAGTKVDTPGQTLHERIKERPGVSYVVNVMKELDIDISECRTNQLIKTDLTKYDLIVSMAGKKYTPKWLETAPNYIYWKVRDPMGSNHDITMRTRNIVREKVKDLIKRNI